MISLERERERVIDDILRDALAQEDNFSTVARGLGISRQTLDRWRLVRQIAIKRVAVA